MAGAACAHPPPPNCPQLPPQIRIYWTAFGKGPDNLNGLGWATGTLASLGTKGLRRAKAAWTQQPPYLLLAPITSANAKPGRGLVQALLLLLSLCAAVAGTHGRRRRRSFATPPPAARPSSCPPAGDLVFYGRVHNHVALYMGANVVLYFGPLSNNLPQVGVGRSRAGTPRAAQAPSRGDPLHHATPAPAVLLLPAPVCKSQRPARHALPPSRAFLLSPCRPARAQVRPFNFRPDADEIRAYTDFLI